MKHPADIFMNTHTDLARLCASAPGTLTQSSQSPAEPRRESLLSSPPASAPSAFSALKIPPSSFPSLPSVNLAELNSLIHRIAAFQTNTFPHQTLQGKLNHLVKEAQEVADCAGNDPHEWADVLNLLLGAALLKGWTLADLVRFAHDKMAICEQRQWPTAPGPDGCYHHIKE